MACRISNIAQLRSFEENITRARTIYDQNNMVHVTSHEYSNEDDTRTIGKGNVYYHKQREDYVNLGLSSFGKPRSLLYISSLGKSRPLLYIIPR